MELDVPTHKLVGEGVKLVCRFDMEGDTLYSVKWYRNEQEFYRFVPNDRPKLQIFPQHGIRVEVSCRHDKRVHTKLNSGSSAQNPLGSTCSYLIFSWKQVAHIGKTSWVQ